MLRILILFLSLFLLSTSALAALSPQKEIKEVKKCSVLFPYFEKKYNLPKNILHSISLQETRKSSKLQKEGVMWPWTVNTQGRGYYFDSKQEAISFVKKKQKQGVKSIDVGCMQINLKHHPKAFGSLEQAFNPRDNIEYAAKMLKNNYHQTKNWQRAVGNYHSKLATRSYRYQASVMRINRKMPAYKRSLARLGNDGMSIDDFFEEIGEKLTAFVNRVQDIRLDV